MRELSHMVRAHSHKTNTKQKILDGKMTGKKRAPDLSSI